MKHEVAVIQQFEFSVEAVQAKAVLDGFIKGLTFIVYTNVQLIVEGVYGNGKTYGLIRSIEAILDGIFCQGLQHHIGD